MLQTHMSAVEKSLLAKADIQSHAGHTLHKGNPREYFISEFLEQHISERVAIGTGEIIDCNSSPGDSRNQYDIVIFRRDFPRLELGGGTRAFLAESVVATIEVKSTLTKEELRRAMVAAKNAKNLTLSKSTEIYIGRTPTPAILNFVVAYDGPAKMQTVAGWLPEITEALGVSYQSLSSEIERRLQVVSPALDGVFVLGKGFLQYQNSPIGFVTPELPTEHTGISWAFSDVEAGSLLLLFLQLTAAISSTFAFNFDPMPYVKDVKYPSPRFVVNQRLQEVSTAVITPTGDFSDIADLVGGQWDTSAPSLDDAGSHSGHDAKAIHGPELAKSEIE